MNSKVIHLLNNLKECSEKTVKVITELKKVDWNEFVKEEITEEDIGKLCWFSDNADFAGKRIGILKVIDKKVEYPYETETGAIYKYCKRLSEEELKEMS